MPRQLTVHDHRHACCTRFTCVECPRLCMPHTARGKWFQMPSAIARPNVKPAVRGMLGDVQELAMSAGSA
eukprot:6903125-Alexandrium_andersonii.AAC.1